MSYGDKLSKTAKAFDKDHISDDQQKRLSLILAREECQPDFIRETSPACYLIYLWLQAILDYANFQTQSKQK